MQRPGEKFTKLFKLCGLRCIIGALCHPGSGRTKMSKSLLLMICIVTGLLVLSCAKTADTNRNAAPANSNAAAPSGSVSTNKNSNTTVAAADKIGIEECDTFLTEYDNCVSTKVPEAARAQYKTAIAQWRSSWKKLADNPQTKGTLANICKTQLETARTQMKSFNCTF